MATEFKLIRGPDIDSNGTPAVQGQLSEPSSGFGCLTLENKAVICPAGRFQLKNAPMVSHGNAIRAELQGVPGRSGIFVHSANEADQLEGCIGVGDSRPTPGALAGGLLHHVADRVAALVAADPAASFITIKNPGEP